MNKGIKPRFWTALNRKWSRTEQEYETSANNFLLAQLGEVSCGKISKTKCWTGIRDKCKQFFACATWRSFLWRHKQSEMLNKNARQEERISHIWLIKRNFFVYCVGIQCRHLPTSQPPLLWPSKCHFNFSPFQDFLFLYLSGFNPDLARRPRNSVFVKHIYVRLSSSIAPKCLFTSLSNANPPHHPANHTIFLQKFSNLINFHYLCA